MTTKSQTRACRVAAATVLAAGLLGGSLGTAASAKRCHTSVDVPSLQVQIDSGKRAYRLGETAKVTVTVLRAAERNVAPKPAPGVDVELGIAHGMTVLRDNGKTGELGSTTLKVRLDRYTPLGWAQVKADAWNGSEAQGPCGTRVLERGSKRHDYLFKVVR